MSGLRCKKHPAWKVNHTIGRSYADVHEFHENVHHVVTGTCDAPGEGLPRLDRAVCSICKRDSLDPTVCEKCGEMYHDNCKGKHKCLA